MTPKEKRDYVDCWDEDKIKQVLEKRIEEIKNKKDKSKSRIKLLRAKIAKLRRALEGKGVAGGQVAPSNNSDGAKSGKRSKKGTKKVDKADDGDDATGRLNVCKLAGDKCSIGDQNTDDPIDESNLDATSSLNTDTRSVTRTAGSKTIDKKRKKSKKICFGCRKRGHLLKDCRENRSETVCFRCGSKEHTLKNCKFKSNSTVVIAEDYTLGKEGPGVAEETKVELPYASCFVCGQVGHLSSQCPQNPKGMYPKGSGCYFCGSPRVRPAGVGPTAYPLQPAEAATVPPKRRNRKRTQKA
ncbi:uncharacterized protein TOT_010000531 [Theileria orientalis strain Shintoku]|uniref:CCHC-type domain-containing protein n=1 Tax=Theileria orientalis strain Shintoku TaxID=869250 RepID=J4C7H9_THEOR|nr:uncharacterized protein TOT_010000531 [Theileria orientalis strain Shintoku]BAM39068.1 uncharacterized protein TOT_010000531 [Theileria orientalis strain Shintoku]|eukprot:XP_009689369.1 uncharacterized protein TOT_010000531 [Theileria orientalis strain Shintoku]